MSTRTRICGLLIGGSLGISHLALILLLPGCCSVASKEMPPVSYPAAPLPLGELFRNPTDGVYKAPSHSATRNQVLVISDGRIFLSHVENGRVITSGLGVVEYRPVLPAEEIFDRLRSGAPEADVENLLGKPNWEGFDYFPVIGLRSRTTKHAEYSWFTLSGSSDLVFMHVITGYTKSKDGAWVAEEVRWEKQGERRLAGD